MLYLGPLYKYGLNKHQYKKIAGVANRGLIFGKYCSQDPEFFFERVPGNSRIWKWKVHQAYCIHCTNRAVEHLCITLMPVLFIVKPQYLYTLNNMHKDAIGCCSPTQLREIVWCVKHQTRLCIKLHVSFRV